LPGSGHRSLTNRALVARLDQGDTGRFRVGRGAAELRVAVMDGEIVAATCREDLRLLLRRLFLAGTVGSEELDALVKRDATGEPVFGELVQRVSPDLLQDVLYDRFVENLTRFLGSAANPRFNHHPTIFEDNFQLGHDADTLLQTCADAWDDAMSVDLTTTLFCGASPPRTGLQRAVLDRVGDGAVLSNLLIQLPAEPFSARALIARMLRSRMLTTSELAEPDTQTEDLPRESAPLVSGDNDVVVLDEPEEWRPESDTPVSVGALFRDRPPPAAPADDDLGATLSPDDNRPAREQPDEGETEDPPTEESRIPLTAAEPIPSGIAHLRSAEDWLNPGIEIEDDLMAFEDHDEVRGGVDGEAGAFSTAEHNLDRVEVAAIEPEPEEIELDESPISRFAAPVLSEQDAQAKIDVARSVVETLSAAMDAAEGRGRAQTAVQLLLDGSPSPFKPLFANLVATDSGSIPADGLLRNLQHRPAGEHRRLLNQGLLNLIERYLSVAVEELPDEAIDQVLEDVAGYRQRLGL